MLKSHAKGTLQNPVVICVDLNNIALFKSKLPKEIIFIPVSKREVEKIIIYANFFTKIEFHTVSLDKPKGNRFFLANRFAGISVKDIIEKCIFNKI